MRALTKILKNMRGDKPKKRHTKHLERLAPLCLSKRDSILVSRQINQVLNQLNPDSPFQESSLEESGPERLSREFNLTNHHSQDEAKDSSDDSVNSENEDLVRPLDETESFDQ